MKILGIAIQNVRMVLEEYIDFSKGNRVIYIGKNNDGKTTLLKALEFFFSQDSDVADLYPKDKDGNFRKDELNPNVIVEFEINEDDKSKVQEALEKQQQADKFLALVQNGRVKVRKLMQHNKEKEKIEGQKYEVLNQDTDKWESIFGVTGSKSFSKVLPYCFFLPSIANVEDYNQSAQKAKNSINDLFEIYLAAQSWEDDPDTEALVKQLKDKISEKLKFEEINKKMTGFLQQIIPSTESVNIRSHFREVKDLQALLKKVDAFVQDGVLTLITEKGMGLQRAYVFSLLRLIADEIQNGKAKTDVLFLLDEPDMHLHPEAQKEIRKTSNILSQSYKVVIATHSHLFMADKTINTQLKKVFKKDCVAHVETLSEENRYREMFTYLGFAPSDFLIPDNYLFVEGALDKGYIEKLIELKYPGEDINVCVQNCCNDSGVKNLTKIFQGIDKILAFFEGLPAYCGKFCAILDESAERSIPDLRKKANDNALPFRIIALRKNGIEYVYPKSITNEFFQENSYEASYEENMKSLLKNSSGKKNLSTYVLEKINVGHLTEVDKDFLGVIELAVENSKK